MNERVEGRFCVTPNSDGFWMKCILTLMNGNYRISQSKTAMLTSSRADLTAWKSTKLPTVVDRKFRKILTAACSIEYVKCQRWSGSEWCGRSDSEFRPLFSVDFRWTFVCLSTVADFDWLGDFPTDFPHSVDWFYDFVFSFFSHFSFSYQCLVLDQAG